LDFIDGPELEPDNGRDEEWALIKRHLAYYQRKQTANV
jgi:hypothetical protein